MIGPSPTGFRDEHAPASLRPTRYGTVEDLAVRVPAKARGLAPAMVPLDPVPAPAALPTDATRPGHPVRALLADEPGAIRPDPRSPGPQRVHDVSQTLLVHPLRGRVAAPLPIDRPVRSSTPQAHPGYRPRRRRSTPEAAISLVRRSLDRQVDQRFSTFAIGLCHQRPLLRSRFETAPLRRPQGPRSAGLP